MNPFLIIRCSFMKKLRTQILCLILFSAAGLSFGSEQTAPVDGLSQSKLQAAEKHLKTITDPTAKLFFQAGIEQAKGDPEQAIQTLAMLIANHANNKKWIARAELLSAELYVELGMLDAADATAREVQIFYKGTTVATDATALRSEIKKARESSE